MRNPGAVTVRMGSLFGSASRGQRSAKSLQNLGIARVPHRRPLGRVELATHTVQCEPRPRVWGRVVKVSDANPKSVPVSAVIPTFFPKGGQGFDAAGIAQADISQAWQNLGIYVVPYEIRGITAGLPHGYMTEVIGRSAAAGEQLGLAFAAVRDAEVWQRTVPEPRQENRRAVAGRALAEAAGLWSISAGHAVTNVVARVVRAHQDSRYLDAALGWTQPPEPFGTDPKLNLNLSLNRDTVKALRRAAKETGVPSLADLVEPLRDLIVSDAWKALEQRRHVGYHRWRPQTVAGGVSTTNPWVDQGDGSVSMTVSIGATHEPPPLETVVTEAREGYDALSSAMAEILATLPDALAGVGVAGVGAA